MQLNWQQRMPGVFWAPIPFGLYRIFQRGPNKFEVIAPSWPSDKSTTKRNLEAAKDWAQEQHNVAMAALIKKEH